MIINSIRMKIPDSGNRVVGVVNITLDGMLAVHGIKILKSAEGLFLTMPSKKIKPGKFEDIVHPVNAEVRNSLERILFKAYDFCVEHKLYAVQFDAVLNENRLSLTEQQFEDFQVTMQVEDNNSFRLRTNPKDNQLDSRKKTNQKDCSREDIFWSWLNN